MNIVVVVVSVAVIVVVAVVVVIVAEDVDVIDDDCGRVKVVGWERINLNVVVGSVVVVAMVGSVVVVAMVESVVVVVVVVDLFGSLLSLKALTTMKSELLLPFL